MSHTSKSWETKALEYLKKSLSKIPCELNELDWKSKLTDNTDKFARHLSAFSNCNGGGYFVFGIDDDGKILPEFSKSEIDEILQRIGNIGNNNMNVSLTIDHAIITYEGINLLIVHVPENENKPIHLRGKDIMESSYKRTSGQTVKMSTAEVKALLAYSLNISFEDQIAHIGLTRENVLNNLNYPDYYRLLSKNQPGSLDQVITDFIEEGFIKKSINESYKITNLGGILFAKRINDLNSIKRKPIRVIIYKGQNKIEALKEMEGKKGYASGFEGLIAYIMDKFSVNEVIVNSLRTEVKMYPEIALREFIANALIHQDFSLTGTGVMVEIFTDRIEITNPGVPLIDTNRFIGANPKSRNETLASMMRRLRICEERGSGVLRAVSAIETYQLPAPKFEKGDDYTKVVIYSHKRWKDMDRDDKIRACYQHTVLEYLTNRKVSNNSIRKRFNIKDEKHTIASRIISDTIEAGLIKLGNPESKSKKHATYIPFWVS